MSSKPQPSSGSLITYQGYVTQLGTSVGTVTQVAGGATGYGLWNMPPSYPNYFEEPMFDWVQVVNDGIDVGEVTVTAYIDINGDGDISFTLSATKKWGDIDDTELEAMDV